MYPAMHADRHALRVDESYRYSKIEREVRVRDRQSRIWRDQIRDVFLEVWLCGFVQLRRGLEE